MDESKNRVPMSTDQLTPRSTEVDAVKNRVSVLTRQLTASSVQEEASPLRIRQVVWVVRDLESSLTALVKGLNLSPTFRDPEIHLLGLSNCVLAVGNSFLEMVSPLSEINNTASKQLSRRSGDGGYMFMLQTSDFKAERDRLVSNGFSPVLEIFREGQVDEMHIHPKDTAKCIVAVSQMFPSWDEWLWAGPDWKSASHASTKTVRGIRGITVQAIDVEAANRQYTKLTGVKSVRQGPNRHRFCLDKGSQYIDLVPAIDERGDGLQGVDLVATDHEMKGKCLTICGMNILLS